MSMIPDFEEERRLYQAVADAAREIPRGDFVTLWIRTEAEEGVSSTGVYYTNASAGTCFVTGGLEKVDAAMYQLWESIAACGKTPFSTAVMEVQSSGKFSINFSYYPLDCVGDWQRAQDWEKAQFGAGTTLTIVE